MFGLEIEDVGWWGRKEGPQDTEKWKELGVDFAGTEIWKRNSAEREREALKKMYLALLDKIIFIGEAINVHDKQKWILNYRYW